MGQLLPGFPNPPGLSGKGFFGPPPAKTGFTAQFLVVGSNDPAPGFGTTPFAAIRDTTGPWHKVNVTGVGGAPSLGARGCYGAFVNAGATAWLISTNQGAGNAFIGVLPFGATKLSQAIDTGFNTGQNLTAITTNGSTLTLLATFLNEVVTTPDLVHFTERPANGPSSYVLRGITRNGPPVTIYVAIGVGSSGTGIVTSPDGITWTNNAANFSSSTAVTSNSIVWDGGVGAGPFTQGFVAVGGGQFATSPDGLTWTVRSCTLSTSLANVILFDTHNGHYVIGDGNGKVFTMDNLNRFAAGTALTHTLSAHPISCAVADSLTGTEIVGDSNGGIWSSPDGGTWTAENPGLGVCALTSLANLQGRDF